GFSLLGVAGKNDNLNIAFCVESLECSVEHAIRESVISSPRRRGAGNYQSALVALNADRFEYLWVRLEVTNVDLLLKPVVELRALPRGPLASDSRATQGLRQQDRQRQTERNMVGWLPLIVHGRHSRYADHTCRKDLAIRVVR